jgi:hypothetical protein
MGMTVGFRGGRGRLRPRWAPGAWQRHRAQITALSGSYAMHRGQSERRK